MQQYKAKALILSLDNTTQYKENSPSHGVGLNLNHTLIDDSNMFYTVLLVGTLPSNRGNEVS